ncbi:MAG: TIGR04255 family protein [Sphingobacteriia bacterium]|nr:TIGR04255 family protein [Sphingobacteriia bacterium]NCC41295.1 TIGR04255 family protein [Gammaproteobacteria bacterium]
MESSITYRKAPLVELIVEIRWPVQTIGLAGGPPIVTGQSAAFDIWFQRLTERLRAQGFHNLERLVPHDGIVLAQQPIFRYSRDDGMFPVIQLGHGVFTVNAGPPSYQSWRTFRPEVEAAVAALVETRPQEEPPAAFSRVALRYIDRFGEDLRGGRSNYAFIRDDLGISLSLPEGLIELAPDEDGISPILALSLPIDGEQDASLTFQVAAGRLGNTQPTDTLMDMTYAVAGATPISTAEVLTNLDKAYEVIHGWFDKLTAKIRARMEPVAEP